MPGESISEVSFSPARQVFFKNEVKEGQKQRKSMFSPLNYALLGLKKIESKMNLDSFLYAKSIVKTPLVDLLTVQKLEKKS